VDKSKEIRVGNPNGKINLTAARKRREDCCRKIERKDVKTPSTFLLLFSKLSKRDLVGYDRIEKE
tara:strand:+ start:2511 stop:2705 length:195 start_codon:yes stop_codon:yes gene_type:complete